MSISWNYTDTSDTSVGSLQPMTINYATDFAIKSNDGKSVVLVNSTSPLDRVETLRFSTQRISNVYSGSGLEAGYQSQNKAGASILIQDNTVLSETDAANNRTDYPITAHLVIKVPYAEVVTADILTAILTRLIGACYEQSGATPGPRLNKLVRGALVPQSMV